MRRILPLVLLFAAVAASAPPSTLAQEQASPEDQAETSAGEDAGPDACVEAEAHRFDFWPGVWDVDSRRRDGSGGWRETSNEWRAEEVLGGCAFVDYADGDFGTGRLKGMGTRYYDPGTDRWFITWLSTEAPGRMGSWEGEFDEAGVGDFFAEIETPNGPLLSRIRWWDVEHDSAEWSHSISRDDGATWTTTWRMTFRRRGPR